MKLFYIGILRNQDKPAVELVSEKDLSAYSRFVRPRYTELVTVFSKAVAERISPGQRLDVEESYYMFHVLGRSEGVCGIIISDHDYPSLVAHQLLSKVVDEFLSKHPKSTWDSGEPALAFPELKGYLSEYQDPQKADSILKIQNELDERMTVLHKTIESVLEGDEKLSDLIAKTDGLSARSKRFYKEAEDQTSRCMLM
ncbi:synaptobrevin [Thelonectria olida]|uniref:Synaptobrevin n=1 Tax=Thelonectria olida TaxID=1576542 RepID=A0A9P8W3I6_9HYPO|nr:synaptobrevin [Thelonectria olida]